VDDIPVGVSASTLSRTSALPRGELSRDRTVGRSWGGNSRTHVCAPLSLSRFFVC